jgi:regulator of sigma E protease
VTIERNGQKMDISIPANIGQQLVDGGVKTAPFSVRLPCVVDSVVAGNKAAEAGLVKGDSVIGLGEVHSIYFNDIKAELANKKGQTVPMWVKRNGQEVQLNVGVNDDGTIGFIPKADVKQFGVETLQYGFFAAIPAGAKWAWETFTDYGSQLKYLFSSSGAKQVGGFGSFAKMFPDQWDWAIFWERTAFISLILAFMNMLPIPALDGGHVMFLLWEMITGRAVSQKILEKAQVVGMVLLLGLMLWGNILDIFRAVVGK